MKLLDIAAGNGDKIFDAKSSNYASVVAPSLISCTAASTTLQNAVNAGHRLILPTRCNISEGTWSGVGYFDIATNSLGTSVGAIISGGLAGGFSSFTWPTTSTVVNAYANTFSFNTLTQTNGFVSRDPIDMVKGNYLYTKNDLSVGVGEFPAQLSVVKQYSSGSRTEAGPLGKGWTHNLNATATESSDGLQSMGEDSALDAVPTLVSKVVTFDLMSDASRPLDKIVIAAIGERWFGDQVTNNSVIVKQGLNGEVFIKLPDGSYNAPPGSSAKLTKNADGTYSYETLNKSKLNFNSAGKIANYIAPNGVQANFTYTGSDLSQIRNSLGRTLTFTNASGRITQVSDGTRTVRYAYDASGNLTTYTDANNQNTTFAYDQPGRMTQLFYPSNPSIAFATNVYDTLNRVQTQTNANGKLYTYYFAGSRSEEVAPGNISKVSYLDSLGKVTKSVDPLGRIVLNTYDGQSRLVRSVLPEGNAVEYDYDDAPCLSQLRCTHNIKTARQLAKPGSGLATLVSSYVYEGSYNKVSSATDPRGKVTTYVYTAQGDPLSITRPADSSGVQPVSTFAYTAFAAAGFPTFYLPTSVTNKIDATNVVVTTTSYNTANKYVPQTAVVDSGSGKLNLSTAFTYDAIGNLTLVDGPRTDVTDTATLAYDSERRVIQATDALGKITYTAYDADGRVVRTAAQIGTQWLVSCQSYTPSGKLLKAWGPAQTAAATSCPAAAAPTPVTDYVYDDLDRLQRLTQNLAASEGGNRVSEMVYNADDTLQNTKRAVGSAVAQTYATYTYTQNGRVASLADAKGNLTSYQYDGLDRQTKVSYPDKVSAGLSSATDYEQYSYDANGNLTSLRKRSGQSITFTYDNLNRLTLRSYPDPLSNVSLSYDLLGRRTAARYPYAGSFDITYQWDNAGRLTSTSAGSKTLAYQYDAAGNRTRTTWPDISFYTTTSYDALNRPSTIKELGVTNLASYAYDDLSRRSTVTLGNGTTTSYSYNTTQGALASLTQNLTGTAQDQSYTYSRNQAGEITTHSWSNDLYQWSGAVNGSKAYTANGLNQYNTVAGTSYQYDNNGNLIWDGSTKYSYDYDNRLTSVSIGNNTYSLSYDPEGRLRRTIINGITNLLYDGTDLIAEYDPNNNTIVRRYVHGPGVDEPLVWYEGSGTTSKTWLYADHQGSIVAQADGTGTSTATYSYGPYGEAAGVGNSRFRYTGQQYFPTLGLYYYKARFYSAAQGRFLQTDPIGYQDDNNLYAYVGNNAINRRDPWGLSSQEVDLLSSGLGGLNTSGSFQLACGPACVGVLPRAMPLTVVPNSAGRSSRSAEDDSFSTPPSPPPGYVEGAVNGAIKAWNNPKEFINLISGGILFNENASDGEGSKPADGNRNKDVPNRGEPGEVKEGERRTREYGADGKPFRDYDKPHQGDETDHVHEWPDGVREHPGRPYSPLPRK